MHGPILGRVKSCDTRGLVTPSPGRVFLFPASTAKGGGSAPCTPAHFTAGSARAPHRPRTTEAGTTWESNYALRASREQPYFNRLPRGYLTPIFWRRPCG